MSWKWHTEPLGWEDKCSMCQQPLRLAQDSGIVIWTDSKQYHIACLLDRLSSRPPPSLPIGEDDRSLSHSGMCDDGDSS
jgi:hypothetical protein